MPEGITVSANGIVEALSKFMKVFKQKRVVIAAGDWFPSLKAPVHTAAIVIDKMVARRLPYSPDRTPATVFSSPGSRESGLASLIQNTFKKEWEGAVGRRTSLRLPTAVSAL
jgi:hypothetical protein